MDTSTEWQILNFGKYKSRNILDILKENPAYCQWLYTQPLIMDTNPDIKNLLDLQLNNFCQWRMRLLRRDFVLLHTE